jgi:hypothetical protein
MSDRPLSIERTGRQSPQRRLVTIGGLLLGQRPFGRPVRDRHAEGHTEANLPDDGDIAWTGRHGELLAIDNEDYGYRVVIGG